LPAVEKIMDALWFLAIVSLPDDNYYVVVSHVTGSKPGVAGDSERLVFIFNC